MKSPRRITTAFIVWAVAAIACLGPMRHGIAQSSTRNGSVSPSTSTVHRPRSRVTVPGTSRIVGPRTYGTFSGTNRRRGYVPRHQRIVSQISSSQDTPAESISTGELPAPEEVFLDGEAELPVGTVLEDDAIGSGCGGYGCAGGACAGNCGACDGNCGWLGTCANCCLIPCPAIPLDNLTLFSGVHGFKNPSNLDRNASFGMQIGANWGAPFWLAPYSGMGMQLGIQGVLSNFSGANFTTDRRNQFFLTTGVFRRADWGLQAGIVFDYMRDDWYAGVDLSQVRGEISWVYPCLHEWGFWFSASDDSETTLSPVDQLIDTWDPTDLFAFFYRRRFHQTIGGEGRFFFGFSQRGDGLLGADGFRPLTERLAIETSYTYLIPKQPRGDGASENEGWNLFVGVVWYPGWNAFGHDGCGNYFRPLFRVADNGSFMVDRFRPGN